MTSDLPLSRPKNVRELNDVGQLEIVATAEERKALAAAFDLPEVLEFAAVFSIVAVGRDAFDVTGSVDARIVQISVVSLEPVTTTVAEAVDLRLVPEDRIPAPLPPRGDVDPEAPEPPEPYSGDSIDFGAIAVEHFALGIDPYPRASDEEFPQEGMGDAPDPADSPFSALAGLKPRPDDGE